MDRYCGVSVWGSGRGGRWGEGKNDFLTHLEISQSCVTIYEAGCNGYYLRISTKLRGTQKKKKMKRVDPRISSSLQMLVGNYG